MAVKCTIHFAKPTSRFYIKQVCFPMVNEYRQFCTDSAESLRRKNCSTASWGQDTGFLRLAVMASLVMCNGLFLFYCCFLIDSSNYNITIVSAAVNDTKKTCRIVNRTWKNHSQGIYIVSNDTSII